MVVLLLLCIPLSYNLHVDIGVEEQRVITPGESLDSIKDEKKNILMSILAHCVVLSHPCFSVCLAYLGTETHVGVLDGLVAFMALVLQVSLVPGVEVVGVGGGSNQGGDADIDGDLAPGLSSG